MTWEDCATAKIRQIERLRPLVGPPFEDNPNTEAVIDAAESALARLRGALVYYANPERFPHPDYAAVARSALEEVVPR